MRKRILDPTSSTESTHVRDELDIPAIATALVTSEAPDHPVEHAFDGRAGPGASRWMAGSPGEQTLILAFDAPQTIRRILLEIEELDTDRTQELTVSVSPDGGQTYRELVRQEYTFSPPRTTFEREDWAPAAAGTTHLRLWIKPDKGGRPCRVSVTSLRLW
jgi:hypothetical protein